MEQEKALKVLKPSRIIFPIILGLLVVFVVAYQDDQLNAERLRLFGDFQLLHVLLLLLVLGAKDLLNAFRFRFLSHLQWPWASALRVILLWEFAIAVIPPVVGAATVLLFIIYKEGQSFGKAVAFTLMLAGLDNIFFITAAPLAIFFSQGAVFPPAQEAADLLGEGVSALFWFSYGMIIFYTVLIFSSVFWFPKTIRKIQLSIMSVSFLKKWKGAVEKQSNELILASEVLKGRGVKYWVVLVVLSYGVWSLKYFLVSIILNGFVPLSLSEHFLMVGRHVVMWVVMLVSPSPGNAGIAELIFPIFYLEYGGQYTFIASLIWRLATYYPYLMIGIILLPRWLRPKKSPTTQG